MGHAICRRFSHAWKIIRWGWFVIYEIGWLAIYTNLDLLIGKYGSEKTKSLWEQWTHPQWGWKSWVIGALTIAIFLLIEGSYRLHQEGEKEKDTYKQKLDEIENTRPHIVLHSKAEYVENSNFQFPNFSAVAAAIKVKLINKPLINSPSGVANGVRARVGFFCGDNLVLEMNGRWSDSDEPSMRDPRRSRSDLLAVDFGIGEEHDLDIAFREPNGNFVAWNNENYNYLDAKKPEHCLKGDSFTARIVLSAPYVKEEFSFAFSKGKEPNEIMLIKHINFISKPHPEL